MSNTIGIAKMADTRAGSQNNGENLGTMELLRFRAIGVVCGIEELYLAAKASLRHGTKAKSGALDEKEIKNILTVLALECANPHEENQSLSKVMRGRGF